VPTPGSTRPPGRPARPADPSGQAALRRADRPRTSSSLPVRPRPHPGEVLPEEEPAVGGGLVALGIARAQPYSAATTNASSSTARIALAMLEHSTAPPRAGRPSNKAPDPGRRMNGHPTVVRCSHRRSWRLEHVIGSREDASCGVRSVGSTAGLGVGRGSPRSVIETPPRVVFSAAPSPRLGLRGTSLGQPSESPRSRWPSRRVHPRGRDRATSRCAGRWR
jgi:hypothetical protein